VDREEFVELTFKVAGALKRIEARKVVLAMPPRLIHEHVELVPPLAPELSQALAATPTWMASQAKALVPFSEAFWRRQGDSGGALSPYPGAVLGEVFDACDSNQQAALGGFFALGPLERRTMAEELPGLVRRQLVELFGPLADSQCRIQDWSTERFTAAALDLAQPAQDPTSTPAAAREPHWGSRLFFGGTETASYHPGHMEGALEAALRLAAVIGKEPPRRRAEPTKGSDPIDPASKTWFEGYQARIQESRAAAEALYVSCVERALTEQDSAGITQRALLRAAASTYRYALSELARAPFSSDVIDPRAFEQYLDAVLAPLGGFSEELLTVAMKSNLSSCAMRNFTEEARPDSEYLSVIRSDLQSVLEEFTRQVERKLRARPSVARAR
jgi:monoamine oxidase